MSDEGRQKIAETIGVNVNDVVLMEQRLSGPDSSLNMPLSSESDSETQNFLADTRPDPEEVVASMHDAKILSERLNEALNELTPRERLIIFRRRLNDEGATLEQLGGALGVSKERVRQLEHRALKKLRVSLEAQTDMPLDLLPQLS